MRRAARTRQKPYILLGIDGRPFKSRAPGKFGGHRGNRVYGRLDCPSALSWLERGHYAEQRVFFASEDIAILAGYRPCAVCMRAEYEEWKKLKKDGLI